MPTNFEDARIAAQEKEWRQLVLEWQDSIGRSKIRIADLYTRAAHAEKRATEAEALVAELRAKLEASEAKLLQATKSREWWDAKDRAIAGMEAKLDASERGAAALREAFGAVIDWQGIEHDDDECSEDDSCRCANVAAINAAFASPTGRDFVPLSVLREWQHVAEYYLGDFAKSHTAAECRAEAMLRVTQAVGDVITEIDALTKPVNAAKAPYCDCGCHRASLPRAETHPDEHAPDCKCPEHKAP